MTDVFRRWLGCVLWRNCATFAIRLSVVGWNAIASGFGVHAKIRVESAIFLTKDKDVLDRGGISRSGGCWTDCWRCCESCLPAKHLVHVVGAGSDHEPCPGQAAYCFEGLPPGQILAIPPFQIHGTLFHCYK